MVGTFWIWTPLQRCGDTIFSGRCKISLYQNVISFDLKLTDNISKRPHYLYITRLGENHGYIINQSALHERILHVHTHTIYQWTNKITAESARHVRGYISSTYVK